MNHLLRRIWFWLSWPVLFLIFQGTRRSRIVVTSDDQLLLVQDRFSLWYDDNGWSIPGGGMHKGENETDAAVRELKEELGIEANAANLSQIWEGRIRNKGMSYKAYFFILRLPEPSQIQLQKTELKDAKWFPLSDLPTPLKREAKLALELLAETS